jgi:hypothetical protein
MSKRKLELTAESDNATRRAKTIEAELESDINTYRAREIELCKLKRQLGAKRLQLLKERRLVNSLEVRLYRTSRIEFISETKKRLLTKWRFNLKQLKKDGEKLDLGRMSSVLPHVLLSHVYEFISYDARIQYLEETYSPLAKFQCLTMDTRMNFIHTFLAKHQLPTMTKFAKWKLMSHLRDASAARLNNEMIVFAGSLREESPKDALAFLKNICILFKKDKTYHNNCILYWGRL